MRVVVVGNNAGAVRVARELNRAKSVQVTVLSSDKNFAAHSHLSSLCKVQSDDEAPLQLSQMLKDCERVKVVADAVRAIDVDRKTIQGARRGYQYDYLVLSGAIEEYAAAAMSLQRILREVREQHKSGFITDTQLVVRGCTVQAVELAAQLHHCLDELYNDSPSRGRVMLATTHSQILPSMSSQSRTHVRRKLQNMGVEVHEKISLPTSSGEYQVISGRKVPISQVIDTETEGVADFFTTQPLVFELDSYGQLQSTPYLEVYDDIFAIGPLARQDAELAPSRVIDMADYAVEHLLGGQNLPYYPPTAMQCVRLADNWSYVEWFGIYAVGYAGALIETWLQAQLARKLKR